MQAQQKEITQEQLEAYWKTLSTVNEWVRFLDTKATALLAAAAALAALGATLLKDNANLLQKCPWLWGFAGLTAAFVLLALGTCLYVITPTLFPGKAPLKTLFDLRGAPSQSATDADSPLYFEHIARASQGRYLERTLPVFADPALLRSHIAEQVQANSIVARDKAHYIGRAVQLMVWAVVCGIVTAIVGGIPR